MQFQPLWCLRGITKVNKIKYNKYMNGYITNIEKSTLDNEDYRRVLFTSHYSQLVLMCIQSGDDIGEEVHGLDQFIRIEKGEGKSILDGEETVLRDGSAVVIPAGTKHNIVNTGSESLKLYSLYSPPNHKDKTVHHAKSDESEEHFDGVTSQ